MIRESGFLEYFLCTVHNLKSDEAIYFKDAEGGQDR